MWLVDTWIRLEVYLASLHCGWPVGVAVVDTWMRLEVYLASLRCGWPVGVAS